MSQIEVPDWVAAVALDAYKASRGSYEGEVPTDPDDMRAALEAALAAMLEPQRQTSYAAHAWLDITEHEYQSIGDEPCTLRTLYTIKEQP